MQAKFPQYQAKKEDLLSLTCHPSFEPRIDLRGGTYQSPEGIKRASLLKRKVLGAGLSLFADYIRSVKKGRRLALNGEYSDYEWSISALELHRLFESYGARFHIEGLDLLRQAKGPYVVAANHMSTLETQVLNAYLTPHNPCTYVVKESLAEGFFAPLICSRPYIALKRKNPLDDLNKVMEEGSQILKEGRSVIIFPQGTRECGHFTSSNFNSIATRLAIKAEVPILPIALSTSFWSSRKSKAFQYLPLLRPEDTVHIAFGELVHIDPASKKGKAEQQQVSNFIRSKLESWGVPCT